MRLHSLLALFGPMLLALPGCTSDLPAPTNYVELAPPRPDTDLTIECSALPITANGARYDQTPITDPEVEGGYKITNLWDEATYTYRVDGELPAGLTINPENGQLTGLVEADPGAYMFDLIVEDSEEPDVYFARATCTLQIRESLIAPLSVDTVPFCLRDNLSLLDVVVDGTGDSSPITCDYPGGNGNGRKPSGIEVDPEACTLTGSIDETRLGTWVFMMRGTQSGREVFVPFCVTNDEPQGYDISVDHSGMTGAELTPIMRTYDPSASFTVGMTDDPRFEITSPGICGASCFYRYSFLRTNAPLENFSMSPDGLVQGPMMASIGFFHELRVDGPAVPAEFRERPWVLSVAVDYCMSDDMNGCDDASAQGDASFEFGLIMVPE